MFETERCISKELERLTYERERPVVQQGFSRTPIVTSTAPAAGSPAPERLLRLSSFAFDSAEPREATPLAATSLSLELLSPAWIGGQSPALAGGEGLPPKKPPGGGAAWIRRGRRECLSIIWGQRRGRAVGAVEGPLFWAPPVHPGRVRRAEEAHPGGIPLQLAKPSIFFSEHRPFVTLAPSAAHLLRHHLAEPSRIELPRSLASPRPAG